MPEPTGTQTQDPPQSPPLDPSIEAIVLKSRLLDELYKNPKTRSKVLALVKEHKPDAQIPELDIPAQVEKDVVGPVIERVKRVEDALTAREAKLTAREERQVLIDQGYTPEQIAEAEKLITDKKVTADLPTAVEVVALRSRVAVPRPSPTSFSLTPDNGKEVKAWMQNPTKKAREEAYKVLAEFRR